MEDDDEEDNRPLGAPPVFIITVGDPQKKGDPLKAHIVYTVHTKVGLDLRSYSNC